MEYYPGYSVEEENVLIFTVFICIYCSSVSQSFFQWSPFSFEKKNDIKKDANIKH